VDTALALLVVSLAVSIASVMATMMIYLHKEHRKRPVMETSLRASEYDATVRNAELANKDDKHTIGANWLKFGFKELYIASAHLKGHYADHIEQILDGTVVLQARKCQ
jgi:hypothetical protein